MPQPAPREPGPEPKPKATRLPAPRPPKTLRERIFHALPPYAGPYHVGYMEIEVPAQNPRHFSHIKRNGEFALKLDTVLFSIYYPSLLPEKESSSRSRTRVPWLPRPRAETCRGYALFLSIPNLPVTAYIAVTSMFTKLHAHRNAKLSDRWPMLEPAVAAVATPTSQDTLVDDDEQRDDNATDDEDQGKPKFPVIIFSHGLGGSRTAYSAVCGELASFGFVVVALEHRDGSGARTFVNKTGESADLESQDLEMTQERDDKPDKRRKRKDKKTKPYYMVDYIFPKDNALDTSPNNARGVDTELRGAQIDMRLAEIEEAFHVLREINNGRGNRIAEQNLRVKGNIGSSSRGLDGVDWADWKGRLYLENVTMMGHSFGGATTVQALTEGFGWVSQGIVVDIWGPAVPESTTTHSTQKKPLLSVGSEAFMHWKDNFDRVERICKDTRTSGALCWMTTIRGSTHLFPTDFALLYPNWMSLLMKTIVNPRRAISLTVHSALEFLKITLPPHQTRFSHAWADEELLRHADDSETQVLYDHRPDDKWVAARLKIANEFSLRLRSWLPWRKQDAGVPRDASGKPLAGLLNWGPGKEVWVHLSPDRNKY
ncbi:platelet-activating factor acetylhydrolase, isoform II-domain-containing protein [Cercophora scortea]|uniref:1-alkyl-2-acetylglycerophosphocholine esterase n=1 Tax=Cercophora scortea TaxID=314031 RepID=A0AAE0MKF3_9PEZI|nr:platelet-activating factor acetylhydrolase, isoform II-domain-containing protein [Cercophora scortea]